MIQSTHKKMTLKIFLFFSLWVLSGCRSFEIELRVLPHSLEKKNLTFKSDQGALELVPGVYPASVELSSTEGEPSYLLFSKKSEKTIKVLFQLPRTDQILPSEESLIVSSEDLKQPIQLTITRDFAQEQDRIEITLTDPKDGSLMALAQTQYKEDETSYDGKTGLFLRSYQRVKKSERGVYIPIEDDPWLGTSLQVLLAPWIYSRYEQVEWKTESQPSTSTWARLISKSPVIDYFELLHESSDQNEAKPLYYLPKKKNQLRFVYTEGIESGSAYHFISAFNAAFAAGHQESSSSSLFSFRVIRSWTLGMSGLASLQRAYRENKILYPRSTREQPEPVFSWTKELPFEKTGISLAAIPTRNTQELTQIYEARVSTYENAESYRQPTDADAPLDFGFDLCSLQKSLLAHSIEDRRTIFNDLIHFDSLDNPLDDPSNPPVNKSIDEMEDYELRPLQLSRYEKILSSKSCSH